MLSRLCLYVGRGSVGKCDGTATITAPILCRLQITCCKGGISLLTIQRNYVYMRVHGQTQSTGFQDRSARAAWMPESPSGESDRSAFCGVGFLRRPRSGSGEVRDGAPGASRRASSQCQCGGLRLFTPVVLPGAALVG